MYLNYLRNGTIWIYNLNGNLLKSNTIKSTNLNLSVLNPDAYLL
jgi:hypothetical protein